MLVTVLAQAATATHVQVDLAKLVLAGGTLVLTSLVGVVAFFLRRLLAGFDAFKTRVSTFETRVSTDIAGVRREIQEHNDSVDEQLGEIQGELQKVTQEMFGPNGDNGMRGDLRKTKELVVRHDRLLVRLADRADVPFTEE